MDRKVEWTSDLVVTPPTFGPISQDNTKWNHQNSSSQESFQLLKRVEPYEKLQLQPDDGLWDLTAISTCPKSSEEENRNIYTVDKRMGGGVDFYIIERGCNQDAGVRQFKLTR